MKTIENVNIWTNGDIKEGKIFGLKIINDNLKNECTFQYVIMDELQNVLISSIVVMSGNDYYNWNDSGNDINENAFLFVCEKLKLVITGDYEYVQHPGNNNLFA